MYSSLSSTAGNACQKCICPTTVEKMPFTCGVCEAKFSRKFHRDRHIFLIHTSKNLVHICRWCGAVFKNVRDLKKHRLEHKPNTNFIIIREVLEENCKIYRKHYETQVKTFEEAVQLDTKELTRILNYEWLIRKTMKASIIYHVELIRLNGEEEERQEVCLRDKSRMVTQLGDVDGLLSATRSYVQKRIDDFHDLGSGWLLDEVICCDIDIGTCQELTGSCGLISITNRKHLKKIKPGPDSNTCFLDAVAYHFVRTDDIDIINDFIEKKLIVNVPMPMKIRNIARFEADNAALGLKVNVLYCEGDQCFPIYFSHNVEAKEHINLVLYHTQEDESKTVFSHFCYIKNINKFLGKINENNRQRNEGERCLNCFSKFTARTKKRAQELLKKHYEFCIKNKCSVTSLPQEGENDILEFKNFNKKYRKHFWGCFDIETKQVQTDGGCLSCARNNKPVCSHKTFTHAEQQPIILSFVLLDDTKTVVYKETFVGDTCIEDFLTCLVSIEQSLLDKLQSFPEYDKSSMTVEEREAYDKATVCHICEEELLDDRCIDHSHTDGRFRGAAHVSSHLHLHTSTVKGLFHFQTSCNILLYDKKISLYAHNLGSFDSNFIMQKIGSVRGIRNLRALPRNTEKMRTISFNSFVLLDSLAFLNGNFFHLLSLLTLLTLISLQVPLTLS